MTGGQVQILVTVRPQSVCGHCWGNGYVQSGAATTLIERCPTCLGTGILQPAVPVL